MNEEAISSVSPEKRADLSRPADLPHSNSPSGPLIEAFRQQLGKWGAAAIEETPAFSCGARRRSIDYCLAVGCGRGCWWSGWA